MARLEPKVPYAPPARFSFSVRADKLRRYLGKLHERFCSKSSSSSHARRDSALSKIGRRFLLGDVVRVLLLGVAPVVFVLLSARPLLRNSPRKPAQIQFEPFSSPFEAGLGRYGGISVVTACETGPRNDAFVVAKSWLAQEGVDEVLFIDWSPRAEHGQRISDIDDRIRVVRVSDDGPWCAARIYNVGIGLALNAHVGIVGCRQELPDQSLLAAMHASRLAYYVAGDVVLVDRDAFRKVGGFREFACVGALAAYRHDAEIVDRLEDAGFSAQWSSPPRTDDAWLRMDAMNCLLHRRDVPSNVTHCRFNVLTSSSRRGLRGRLRSRKLNFPSILETTYAPDCFTAIVVNGAWGESVGRELHDTFGVVWDVLIGFDEIERYRLLQKLRWRQERIKEEVASSRSAEGVSREILSSFVYERPRLMVVHVMHGLGNRLRALASAMAFAERTDRELVLIWERSPHCGAFFDELFKRELAEGNEDSLFIIRSFPVLFEQFEYASIRDFAWREWNVFNYMSMDGASAMKDEPVVDDRFKHIYFKSAFVMRPEDNKLTGWDLENQQLARLVPVDTVRDLVRSYSVDGLFSEHTVGVHVRSLNLTAEKDIDALSEYGAGEAEILAYWRSRSQSTHFVSEMQRLLAVDKRVNFFVASDSWRVVFEMRQAFPGRVLSAKSLSCDGRSATCMRFALADLMLLGKTLSMLGSPWSSFTEGARRFGCRNVRIAGLDFALDRTDMAELPTSVKESITRMRAKGRKKGKRNL